MGNKISPASECDSDESYCKEETPAPDVAKTAGIIAEVLSATNVWNHVRQTTNHFYFRSKIAKSFTNVPAPIHNFQGRVPLLKSIHMKLHSCPKSVNWQRNAVALVGYGGMGKPELARKLVADHKSHYPNVAWIESETENDLKTSFLH